MDMQDDTHQEPETNQLGASVLNSNTFSQCNLFNDTCAFFFVLNQTIVWWRLWNIQTGSGCTWCIIL